MEKYVLPVILSPLLEDIVRAITSKYDVTVV